MTHPLEQPLLSTSLLNNEALLGRMVEQLGVGCWHWSAEAGLAHSPACLALIGLGARVRDDLGWLDRVHPDDVLQLRSQFDRCVAGELVNYQSQYRILHHDGHYRRVWERVARTEMGGVFALVHPLDTQLAPMLQQVPLTDPLTGSESRQRFEARLAAMVAAATPFSVIAFEVDFLEKVRQLYGKDAADDTLVRLIRLVRHQVGEGPTIARWEDNLFLLALPQIELESALLRAESLRQKIAEAQLLPHRPITASFGVVMLKPGEPLDHMLARLLQRLQAARLSHNRVAGEVATQGVPG
ncbi:MAG: GGDEF domain-containing protein [Aeromonadaceae bacterium]